ncbi:hypothetical protein [Lacinutrix jangbogonensis]|uniref:hypothetical protein n=1 Tax=Lacinutrix jangbogonensis TaxID=1469557 RepID=UPI00053D58B3|nr:hypothetical protein [Lacinutrix jangbogonensis]
MYKLTNFGTITRIPLTESNIQNIEGQTIIENDLINVRSLYNGSSFANKFSITLLEPGTFYLSGNRFNSHDDGKLTIDGGVFEFGYIRINSTIINANANGGYEFTVD